MECIVLASNLVLPDCTILVVRRENHTDSVVVFEIIGTDKAYTDRNWRYFGKCQAETAILHCGYAAVLDAERLLKPFSKNRWEFRFLMEVYAVFAANQPEIGESGEIVISIIYDYARVSSIEPRVILVE